jgi:hypothetical protein
VTLTKAGVRDTGVSVPGEPAGPADLTAFLEGEAFVLHLADSLAKQSLRSLTAGGADCDTEAPPVVDESRGVELAQVVQLRAAVGGGVRAPAHWATGA